jgi:hypothetical protein
MGSPSQEDPMIDDTTLASKLQALVDRSEILECLNRYARGMDRHDREMVCSAYHEGSIDVHGSMAFRVGDFIDWAFAYHEQQLHHQHYLTNVTIELDGDVAHAESYYLFVGRYPDRETPLTVAGGRYVDRLERRDGRWGSRLASARRNGGPRRNPSCPTAARRRSDPKSL